MERVRLVHGNGGRFSHELTERFILKYFTNDLLAPLHDGAQFPCYSRAHGILYGLICSTTSIFPWWKYW